MNMHTLNELRKIFLFVSFMIVVHVVSGQAVKNIARPVQWKDNNTLELIGMSNMRKVTYEYDSKSGTLRELQKKESATIDISALISKDCKNKPFSLTLIYGAYTRNNDLYQWFLKPVL